MPVVPTAAMPLSVFRKGRPRPTMEARRAGCAVRKGGTIWTRIAYRARAGSASAASCEYRSAGGRSCTGRREGGGRRDPEGADGTHGRGRHARGHRVPGPHPHVPEDSAQARRERRRGEAEGQERDHPAREAPRAEEGDGRGRALWARGFYMSTVGLNESVVRRCIQRQEEGSRME